MDEKDVFEKIRIILADILEMAPNEISRDSSLLDDLGIESVDLLNINLKIENAFHIQIQGDELWNVGLDFVDNEKYIQGEMLTKEGLAEIKRRFPQIDTSQFGDDAVSFYDIIGLITVGMIVDYVLKKLNCMDTG